MGKDEIACDCKQNVARNKERRKTGERMYAVHNENENRSERKIKWASSQGNVCRAFEINPVFGAPSAVFEAKRA